MGYTDEKNVLILLSLLKKHQIKRIIVSPGTTNITFVASLQSDPYFEVFSAPDERSAAYIACGMAEESGEPVVLSCTGATASRNYVPGLTEAYYRNLPVLAVTSTQHVGRIGQNIPQVINRSVIQKDIAKLSVFIPLCHSKEDEWACTIQVNRALLELTHNGCGPVHINMETGYSQNFQVEKLPEIQLIHRVEYGESFPELPSGSIGVFVGAHSKWNEVLTNAVNQFCEKNNAVVLCDQTSNYRGPYRVLFSLIICQSDYSFDCNHFDLIIHIGNVSGAYPSFCCKEEWRVNPDGEVRDTFGHLSYVFQMREETFFEYYSQHNNGAKEDTFIGEWKTAWKKLNTDNVEIPFSNIWLASQIGPELPKGARVHLGILNTLRSWNFIETPENVSLYSNTGGFGIDGDLSSAIGASLCYPNQLVYCILGDLAFFYDMNSLGNRHVGNNLRIVLINNGKGAEFRNYNHPGARFGDAADPFIAAAGHYGAKSTELVKHYSEDLGFEYWSAHNKEEAIPAIMRLLEPRELKKPILFEAFTDSQNESDALYSMMHLLVDESVNNQDMQKEQKLKKTIKRVVGDKVLNIYRILKYGE